MTRDQINEVLKLAVSYGDSWHKFGSSSSLTDEDKNALVTYLESLESSEFPAPLIDELRGLGNEVIVEPGALYITPPELVGEDGGPEIGIW